MGRSYRRDASGVPIDENRTIYWFTKAAEQGHAGAQFVLGLSYDFGVNKDPELAFHWYNRAAEQGYADAQYHLASLYNAGEGVPQNYAYAYAWVNLAAAQGKESAITVRDIWAKRFSMQQLSQFQELAAELQQKLNNRNN